MLEPELQSYALAYEAKRLAWCKQYNAVFPPLEVLTEMASGTAHLSVSFSGTGISAVYLTQRASFYRAVKIKMKFLILPLTVSKLFSPPEFSGEFADLLETREIEGEVFWVLPAEKIQALAAKIREMALGNEFRNTYAQSYIAS